MDGHASLRFEGHSQHSSWPSSAASRLEVSNHDDTSPSILCKNHRRNPQDPVGLGLVPPGSSAHPDSIPDGSFSPNDGATKCQKDEGGGQTGEETTARRRSGASVHGRQRTGHPVHPPFGDAELARGANQLPGRTCRLCRRGT